MFIRQYIIVNPVTHEAAVIDPVLDYDPASGSLATTAADILLAFISEKGLKVLRILYVVHFFFSLHGNDTKLLYSETHAHADHLTGAQYIKKMLGGDVPICIGERIKTLQTHFAPVYGFATTDFVESFDIFLEDEEEFKLGPNIPCKVIHLPGHTPDHIGFVVGKAVFTGDSIFMVRS